MVFTGQLTCWHWGRVPLFANGRNKLGESLIKPCLEEDHNGAPQNHGYFGPGSPLRRPLIFVGAPDNSDYSGQNVRERHQKEANGQGIGQTGRDRCYGGGRRYDICDRAIGDSIFPERLGRAGCHLSRVLPDALS